MPCSVWPVKRPLSTFFIVTILVTNEVRRSRMRTADVDESTCIRAGLVSFEYESNH